MSKLKYLFPILGTVILVVMVFVLLDKQPSKTFKQPKDYTESISYLREINLSEVEEKLDKNESFILYIGRESCPYCRRFVPKLAQAVFENEKTVYYLDSESEDKKEITAFASEMGIKTVPSLGYYDSQRLSQLLEKGSKSPVKEIKNFLER